MFKPIFFVLAVVLLNGFDAYSQKDCQEPYYLYIDIEKYLDDNFHILYTDNKGLTDKIKDKLAVKNNFKSVIENLDSVINSHEKLVTYIEMMEVDLHQIDTSLRWVSCEERIKASEKYFLNDSNALKLKRHILGTAQVYSNVFFKYNKEIDAELEARDVPYYNVTWERDKFDDVSLSISQIYLKYIQIQSALVVNEILNHFLYLVTEKQTENIKSKLIISAPNVVFERDEFKISIGLGSYDTLQKFEVMLNSMKTKSVNGVATFKEIARREGKRQMEGFAEYFVNGERKGEWFTINYNVIPQYPMVSPDVMNILYIGVDNPVSITVPGYSKDRIYAAFTGDTLIKNSNTSYDSYIAKVSKTGYVTLNVSVKKDDSSMRSLGGMRFRVKKIPTPAIQLGTLHSGSTEIIETVKQNATTVYSSLGEGFPIEGIKYTVNKFTVTIAYKDNKGMESVDVTGDKLNEKATELINKIKPGDKIIIDTISVTGPDGERTASPFIVTAK